MLDKDAQEAKKTKEKEIAKRKIIEGQKTKQAELVGESRNEWVEKRKLQEKAEQKARREKEKEEKAKKGAEKNCKKKFNIKHLYNYIYSFYTVTFAIFI